MSDLGKTLINDVFHRADKNDDGQITLEEFVEYFGDGVLSQADLVDLFQNIDESRDNNVQIEELQKHFLKDYADFGETFQLLHDLQISISALLKKVAESNHNNKSAKEQFVVRFYLNESVKQLVSMQQPLIACVNHLEENAKDKESTTFPASKGNAKPESTTTTTTTATAAKPATTTTTTTAPVVFGGYLAPPASNSFHPSFYPSTYYPQQQQQQMQQPPQLQVPQPIQQQQQQQQQQLRSSTSTIAAPSYPFVYQQQQQQPFGGYYGARYFTSR